MFETTLKILLITGLLFFSFWFYHITSAGQVNLQLVTLSGVAGSGLNEFIINVISDMPLAGLGFRLKDTPDVLTVTSGQVISPSGKFDIAFNDEAQKGTKQVTLALSGSANIASGISHQIKFYYDIAQDAPLGNVNLTLEEVEAIDANNNKITPSYSSGVLKVIDYGSLNPPSNSGYGDVYPDNLDGTCGDGAVDIFDILEEGDLVLGAEQPTACQKKKADVPTGSTPNCSAPNNVIDIFDQISVIDKVVNRPCCLDLQSKFIRTPLNIKAKQVVSGSYVIWSWSKIEEAEKYIMRKYNGINCDESQKIGDQTILNSSNPEWKQTVSSSKEDNYSIRIQSQKGTNVSPWSRCVNSVPPPPWYAESVPVNSGVLLIWGEVPEIASAWGYHLEIYEGAGCSNKYLTSILTSAGLTSYDYSPGSITNSKVISYFVRACYDPWSCSIPTRCWTTVLK